VLLLGAGGNLGRLVRGELERRGHDVATIDRACYRDSSALATAARPCGAIVNCAGASVALARGRGWRGYRAVDTPIGLATVAAARATGVRLVYVGAHVGHASIRHTWYVDAHERVAAAMSGVDGVVVRATGFYSAFGALVELARRGTLVDVGRGNARTNPIGDRDLAAIVAEAVAGPGPREIAAGGPDVLTRRDIFDAIAAAAADDKRARVVRVPRWLGAAGATLLCAVHPRMGQFARFAARLAAHDMIAPRLGTRTFAAYLRGN
jgi:uncharacterized protein YbjT (DUF2867 family)